MITLLIFVAMWMIFATHFAAQDLAGLLEDRGHTLYDFPDALQPFVAPSILVHLIWLRCTLQTKALRAEKTYLGFQMDRVIHEITYDGK